MPTYGVLRAGISQTLGHVVGDEPHLSIDLVNGEATVTEPRIGRALLPFLG